MREAVYAELLLSLVMTSERAAATVGDLVEEPESRARFWFAVARMLAAGLGRDLLARPFQMLTIAFSAWWGQMVDSIALFALVVIPMGLAAGVLRASEIELVWAARLTAPLIFTAAPLLAGWRVGKRSEGREVATALIAALALPFAVPTAVLMSPFLLGPLLLPVAVHAGLLGIRIGEFFVMLPFVLTGAILYRFSQRSSPSRGGTV